MSKLGSVSRAILEYVNERPGYIELFRMISIVSHKTGERHMSKWYFRRLVALALEGLIDANVYRGDDDYVNIRFRRLQPNGLEELPEMEEAE